jgi:hypothetical protein
LIAAARIKSCRSEPSSPQAVGPSPLAFASWGKAMSGIFRMINRARWSTVEASQLLLRLRVRTFAPDGELVAGIEDTSSAAARRKDQGQGPLP